ncbi:MAG TPA: MMPL family transporter [Actinomycetota bacterium]|nr:MMPL family transporter [Actinomycetota bacterium]
MGVRVLERLGRWVVRRRKVVLAASAVAIVVSAVLGAGVAERLSSGGFDDPGAESSEAARILESRFKTGDPNLVLLVTARQGSVDSSAVAAQGAALTEELSAERGIDQALSYWSLFSAPPLRSRDGRQALVLARMTGTEDEIDDRVEVLSQKYTRSTDAITVGVTGFAEVFRQIGTTIERDLARAEAIAIPVTLVLLVLVFGSVVAASMPLAVGIVAVIGTFLVLRIVASVTQVSIFALNLTTAMGLGLAIDYALFVVSRFREEMRNGMHPHDAVVRSVQTAGRTVAFSALTVAVSLAVLLLFPLAFLRSFAYAGIAVLALTGLGAVVVLPALLAVLGPRIDNLRILRREPKPVGEGFWHRVAMFVMRRPIPIGLAVVALLLFLGAPFLRIELGLPDDRVLPPEISSRRVSDEIRKGFESKEAGTVAVVAAESGPPRAVSSSIDSYATALSKVDGVSRVDAFTGFYVDGRKVAPAVPQLAQRFSAQASTWLAVVPSVEPLSERGERLVRAVRSVPSPFQVVVGGPSAQLVDAKETLLSRMPLAAGIIGVVTFVVLFLMFGSLLVPLKAVVLNLLSLTATFGAMVWIFQDGHLSGLLGFTAIGNIAISTPILMFCIAFGLSMDYEVFLLSRIKEEHDRTHDNQLAVAVGLERTGRLVTAAAALIAVVFLATATSKVSFIKLFGLGLTMAVIMDATLIRGALVPAFMRLAGEANWWLPKSLRRFHTRFGIRESGEPDAGAEVAGPPSLVDESDPGEAPDAYDETDEEAVEEPGEVREPVTVARGRNPRRGRVPAATRTAVRRRPDGPSAWEAR